METAPSKSYSFYLVWTGVVLSFARPIGVQLNLMIDFVDVLLLDWHTIGLHVAESPSFFVS